MEVIIWLAVIVLSIWLIVLFVGISTNIRQIKVHFVDTSHFSVLTRKDVNLAILTDTKEILYNRIVKSIFESYYTRCSLSGDQIKVSRYNKSALEGIVAKAEGYCKKLGYELPVELKSMEAFIAFYNS